MGCFVLHKEFYAKYKLANNNDYSQDSPGVMWGMFCGGAILSCILFATSYLLPTRYNVFVAIGISLGFVPLSFRSLMIV